MKRVMFETSSFVNGVGETEIREFPDATSREDIQKAYEEWVLELCGQGWWFMEDEK